MSKNLFCIYGVSAIIERKIGNEVNIIIQERDKGIGSKETGLIEIPCGKVASTESAFDVIRKKVYSETGLTVTNIIGETNISEFSDNGYRVISFSPFHVAQNLEDNYSITIDFFLCEATGEHIENSDDAKNIRWIPKSILKKMLNTNPEKFYPMVYDALVKYCAN